MLSFLVFDFDFVCLAFLFLLVVVFLLLASLLLISMLSFGLSFLVGCCLSLLAFLAVAVVGFAGHLSIDGESCWLLGPLAALTDC